MSIHTALCTQQLRQDMTRHHFPPLLGTYSLGTHPRPKVCMLCEDSDLQRRQRVEGSWPGTGVHAVLQSAWLLPSHPVPGFPPRC